jgi:hypothetical protein
MLTLPLRIEKRSSYHPQPLLLVVDQDTMGDGTAMPKANDTSFNLILPALLFVSTSIASIVQIKQLGISRRSGSLFGWNRSFTCCSSRRLGAIRSTSNITKKRALALRNKYFSKALSVSYANSDPLMIVKVNACMQFLFCIFMPREAVQQQLTYVYPIHPFISV